MQKRLVLIISIVLALIAMFLVKVYIDQQSKEIKEKAGREITERQRRQASVLVARRDIPRGAIIDSRLLELKVMPREYIQPQAVSSPERIEGMVVVAPISKGEQITLSKLLSRQQVARGSSLAMATPIGKRAVTVLVDNISSLMGMLRAGDYVDVIGLIPIPTQTPEGRQTKQVAVMPLFQNVLVLAVGTELAGISGGEARYQKETEKAAPLVTLALSPQEANLIAFVQEQGKIRLTLRSPADSQIELMQPANWETLFRHIMPQSTQAEEQIEILPKAKTVEIYRGLKKESMPLSR